MHILGIGGSDHDFSAALLSHGKIIVAIEDERITRIKRGKGKWYKTPTLDSIAYCLNAAGITQNDLTAVYTNTHLEKRALWQKLPQVQSISHHLAHAAYAYFSGPFDKADIVVIDGTGSRVSTLSENISLETISYFSAENSSLQLLHSHTGTRAISTCYWRYMTTNSLGSFYEAVTDAIGFNSHDAGKTMGLASYGREHLFHEMKQFVTLEPEGRFVFDPYSGIFEWLNHQIQLSKNPFSIRADLARAAQMIFEEALVHLLNHTSRTTKNHNLCYTGGCALNTVANSLIRAKTPYRNISIPPASGDSGTSIGAALYGYHVRNDMPRFSSPSLVSSLAYLGKDYSEEEILSALESYPVCFYRPPNIESEVAIRIHSGDVLGWFQGRSEFGPRALGNRSILACPKRYQMRNYINLKIKQRESFRPFAPVVIEEEAAKYFDIDHSSPFMLFVARVKKSYQHKLAAITHVDGTARVQTVTRSSNPSLHSLLSRYKEFSGIPVLLNTSFNGPDEPIVESPSHAIRAFLDLHLDALAIGPYIVERYTSKWADK